MTPIKPAPNEKRRDAQAHQEILNATTVLLEELGYKKLSIEAIAARAGVGKQTIYRWWKGKADLVIEAFTRATAGRAADVGPDTGPDTGNLERDLRLLLESVFRQNEVYDRGAALATKSMMAEAQLDREFLGTFRALVQSWHVLFVEALERGKARGELSPNADSAALVDLMMGATWYRVLLEHAPLDNAYAGTIIRTVLDGNRTETP
ncbi:TetR/AcrR family transcriptional regulator [Deinococcus sp. UYEF24]